MIGRSIYCRYVDFTERTTKVTKWQRKAWRLTKSLFHHWEKSQPLFWCLQQVAKKSKKQSGSATCYSEITLCCMSLAPLYTHIHTQSSRFLAVIYIKALITIWYTPTKKRASPLEQQVGFSHHHWCHSHNETHPSLVRRCLQCQKTVFNRGDLQDLNNSTYRRDLVRNLALIWFAVISF